MLVLGVQAVGAALIWGVATATPEILPMSWLGPIAALWVGVCLLSGGWILTRLRHPVPTISPLAAGPAVLKLPPKSTERKNAETDAVVRNALMEQQEDREERSLKRMLAPGEGREKAHGSNGTHAQNGQKPEDLFEPGGDTPRFEL